MFEHKKIFDLNDFFIKLGLRTEKGVYFYRINGYNAEIQNFIKKYYEVARLQGVVIEGKIQNPTESNLSYYSEIMGFDFQPNIEFIDDRLKKWLPRMDNLQRHNVANCVYDYLMSMKRNGKNDNMLRNAYIKFMCWFYYKFERILNQLGKEEIPKILYEGDISNYELMFMTILSNAGCDIVLLQYNGDQSYLKLDPLSEKSDNLTLSGLTDFPKDFNIKWLREKIKEEEDKERLYGIKPDIINCTNAWISGNPLEDIRVDIAKRGNDPKLFYNCFCQINGVEDKLTYSPELYQFQLEIKSKKRRIVIINDRIPEPTMEEINSINRRTYANKEQMITDLVRNLQYINNIKLQRIAVKAFIDVILREAVKDDGHMNRLTNKAVILLCWIKRYLPQLFPSWQQPEISCFFLMSSGNKSKNEELLLKIFARMPVDVLILNPNLNIQYKIDDSLLFEVNYMNSLNISKFPQENGDVRIGTAAYHAERELDTLMYQNSGIYRNQQFIKASTINLHTMYEEISILWEEEIKYRPNFNVVDDIVNIPVIFSKISGVKDGMVSQYWNSIRQLYTNNSYLISKVPFIESTAFNPIKQYAAAFLKNKRIQRNIIKEHKSYQYGYLREEIQEYMLDKLQLLINEKLIKGTLENGTEYTIISTVLNMPNEIIRLIQKFDFTKKNPKLIYINSGEKIISIEDSIMIAFLNLIGFDIVFFVPTGYQSVEKFFNKTVLEEHQIGEYIYDLQVPDLSKTSSAMLHHSWRDKLFRRDN